MTSNHGGKTVPSLGCVLLALVVSAGLTVKSWGQEKVLLKDVRISGNLRVEDDGIRLHLKSRPGEAFNSATV